MKMYAIIEASGKQFWVEEKRFYDFNKLPLNPGETIALNKILFVNKNGKVNIGKPFLDKSFFIEGTVLRHLSGQKIRVYKMRPKKKTRKTFGSRQKLTRVFINVIAQQTNSICYL